MPLHLPTLLTRTGSAIVFGAIMLAGLLWNDAAFLALALLIHALCLRDYFCLMGKMDGAGTSSLTHIITQIAGGLWVLSAGLLALRLHRDLGPIPFRNEEPVFATFTVLVYPVTLLLLSGLTKRLTIQHALTAFGGVAYITLSILCLVLIRGRSPELPVALIIMIWSNDTLAYLVGSLIGKTPFSPISPKKTWEGTAGGAILTLVAAGVYAWYAHQSLAIYLGLALCATIAGTLGDLLESKLKRMAGVKDSGNLMPGHGGALDRFDSLLVATPFACCTIFVLQFLHAA
jgi:phosphatidate cytidylyltransferase